ncbi:LOW QUALITY PROTEIN: putative Phosphatidylinositol N-acetylglucosaminyltransferase subunit Y [Leishmania naiffi]|uniref:Phosphatidylinositol N-acetylglucosaminyltransferase subunit Y n=1 Tax=Leishmania naiffi TaxID=5678 RepID=A0AAW3BVW5_9TRYP
MQCIFATVSMESPMYDASLTINESVAEGNALTSLDKPPLFFAYTTLICSLLFMMWFVYNTCTCLTEETMTIHRALPILDPRLYRVLWVGVSPQLLFFCLYGTWFGWKFFKHNGQCCFSVLFCFCCMCVCFCYMFFSSSLALILLHKADGSLKSPSVSPCACVLSAIVLVNKSLC